MIKNIELEKAAYDFKAKMPLRQAIPLGLQHVFAMFVGNLTPLLIITSACGLAGGEFADLQISLLQNAMFVAGIVTLVQLFSIGPVGGQVPIIMGTSSGFLGVFNSVAASMGGGVLAYGAIMGASILGGLFETVLGFFLKPLRKFFPSVVTGTVVLSIGLSLISVGVNSFGGGNAAKDFGSMENLLLAVFVLVVILFFKHWTNGFLSSSSILIGIVAGYIAAFIMGFILPTTGVTADGVEFTKAWVLNWNKVAQASWFAIPKLVPVKIIFDMRAILPVLIMFICIIEGRKLLLKTASGWGKLLSSTAKTCCSCGAVSLFAMAGSNALTATGFGDDLTALLSAMDMPKFLMILIIGFVIALVAGPLNATSTTVSLGPVAYSAMVAVGVSPVTAIVSFLIFASTEGASPPMSSPIFVSSSIAGVEDVSVMFKALIFHYVIPIVLVGALIAMGFLPIIGG